MNIADEQTTSQFTRLFEQVRDYLTMQKDLLSLNSVQVLTRLLSMILLWTVLLLVGSLVILFASFAIAYWLGNLLESEVLGFIIVAGVLLLSACIFYLNRRAWVFAPITGFMVSLLASFLTPPTEEAINLEKERLTQKIEENQQEIKDTANTLLNPMQTARNRWESAAHLLYNGWNIYRGLQLGLSAVAAIRRVFGRGRKRLK